MVAVMTTITRPRRSPTRTARARPKPVPDAVPNDADTPAGLPDIDTAIANMPESHLHCRDYGHQWRRHSARFLPDQRVYEQSLKCGSCKTIRRRVIGERGQLISNRYEYVEGYVIPGVGRFDVDMRASVRLASVLSTITPRSKTA